MKGFVRIKIALLTTHGIESWTTLSNLFSRNPSHFLAKADSYPQEEMIWPYYFCFAVSVVIRD